ncbi:AfsR/SARP family transcriptional regulator [Deinococcus altitudinis]|uniref:AfsR/SARP family transcriptional regulator n=1 Tax=Deinococcus altitudinis TaxID=468914 RepID=UPI0038914820
MLHTLGGLHLEGAAHQQAGPLVLLAYLALEGSQERRSVQELFFPGHADAAGRLRMMLHRLKKAAPQTILETLETPGTRLQTSLPSDVAELFRAAEAGEAEQVLSLYRGRFLDGIRLPGDQELEEWVFATRERLTARVRFSHLALGRVAALRGEGGRALAHAERAYLLPGAPEPEADEARLLALLLTATGSSFAADARSEVRHLGLNLPAQAGEARTALSNPGGGERGGSADQVAGERREDGSGATPSDLSASGPSVVRTVGASASTDPNLPALLGREDELAQLDACYAAGARMVTLLGQGGVGKTLLARHALSRAVIRRASAQTRGKAYSALLPGLLVDLSAVQEAGGVLPAIASASQARTASPADVAQAVQAYGLLVLDNFEQVLPAATQVSALLGAAPQLNILVTSRERLNLAQEHVLPLQGLSLWVRPAGLAGEGSGAGGSGTGSAPVEKGTVPEGWSDAARLFVRRAARAHLGFLPEPHRAGIEQVCTLLQGVPLLIELASAWVRTLSPADIAAQLDEGRTRGADLSEPDLDLLETRDRNVPARHASARAVLEASWTRLSPQDQALLSRLSVFLSDFTVKAARQVTGATLSGLANLTDKSWLGSSGLGSPGPGSAGSGMGASGVGTSGLGAPGRLSWHPLARAFVREVSGSWESGNWQQMLPAHAHYFAQGLDASRFQVEGLAELLGEWPDIGQATRTLARLPEDWPTLIRLADEVPNWADQVGNYASVAGLIGRVLDALPVGASPRAPLLRARAFMFRRMHRLPEAAAELRQAAELFQNGDDEQAALDGLDALAVLHYQSAEYEQAQAVWLEILPRLEPPELVKRKAYTLHYLAVNAWMAGQWAEAETWIRAAIRTEQTLPPRVKLVQAQTTLGLTLTRLGRRAEAHAALSEGLNLAYRLQAVGEIPQLLNTLAINLLAMDMAGEGVKLCLEALEKDQMSQPALRADMLDTLALCYARTGQLREASLSLAQSTQLTLQTQDLTDLLHRICTYTIVNKTLLPPPDHAGILHWLLNHEQGNASLKDTVLRELQNDVQPSKTLPLLDPGVISAEAQQFCGYRPGKTVISVSTPV